jgi:outer membrane lipoprotein-sorting protein
LDGGPAGRFPKIVDPGRHRYRRAMLAASSAQRLGRTALAPYIPAICRRILPMPPFARRRLLAAACALTLLAGPASAALPTADAELLGRIEAYLNSIRTLEARFEQIAPDGSLASGRVYIQRPGKMRFDYDPPSKILLVATDWRLIFWDGSIEQQNVIPVSQTPLGFLLGEKVGLDDEVQVTAVERRGGEVHVTVIRKDDPDLGSVTLTFAEQPIELRRWSVTDAQGQVTRILLDGLETGKQLDPQLFNWRDPKAFGPPS